MMPRFATGRGQIFSPSRATSPPNTLLLRHACPPGLQGTVFRCTGVGMELAMQMKKGSTNPRSAPFQAKTHQSKWPQHAKQPHFSLLPMASHISKYVEAKYPLKVKISKELFSVSNYQADTDQQQEETFGQAVLLSTRPSLSNPNKNIIFNTVAMAMRFTEMLWDHLCCPY